MYKTDIERLVAHARRIEALGTDLLNDADALAEEGFDTTTSSKLAERQTEMQDELEQVLLDFEVALERSDAIGTVPEYRPPPGSFEIQWDSTAEEATIEYTDDVDLMNQYITVTVAGAEQNSMFSDPTTTGETETVDTSSMAAGEEVRVEWVATDTQSSKHTFPNGTRAPVSKDNLPPQSALVSDTQTYAAALTVER